MLFFFFKILRLKNSILLKKKFNMIKNSNIFIKSLTLSLKRSSGRSYGSITVLGKGGGYKRRYKLLDFKRSIYDIPCVVRKLEYDFYRKSFIFLVCYSNSVLSYILASSDVEIGGFLISSRIKKLPLLSGNSMPLKNFPNGVLIHNIEYFPYSGGKVSRSSGSFAQVLRRIGDFFVLLKLKSGEYRLFNINCLATYGSVLDKRLFILKSPENKAGESRWLGKKSKVRGVAKNPVDHPHGGGQGKTTAGRHPVSPTAKLTKGKRTRKLKFTNGFIVKPRYLDKYSLSMN